MTEALAVRDPIALQRPSRDPEEIIAQGKRWADGLMRVVRETGISKKIGNKEHLQLEAWQTIATFDRKSFTIEWTRPIERQATIVGFEARAGLVDLDTGLVTVHAEASCLYDEENWTDRDEYAIKSMAQTRACGKVGRMAYAWVAVLAGYSGTPAEEMGVEQQEGPRVPFGKHKGKPVAELSEKRDIAWLIEAIGKSIADPDKKRFKTANERLYDALTARLAELTASPAAPHPPAKEASDIQSPPAAGGAPDNWREKFRTEVRARAEEFDPSETAFRQLLADAGYQALAGIPSYEKAKEFFKEYIKRTGKQPRQEGLL